MKKKNVTFINDSKATTCEAAISAISSLKNIFWILGGLPKKGDKINLFNNKKILLVSVPGAFTPTCSEQHLPGYIKLKNDILSKGIDKIYFVSVNDPFVMQEWAKTFKENDIGFIADSYGDLLNEIEAMIDLTAIGLGKRLSRFSMIIDNGLVSSIFDEEGGGLDKSKAENVLEFL